MFKDKFSNNFINFIETISFTQNFRNDYAHLNEVNTNTYTNSIAMFLFHILYYLTYYFKGKSNETKI